MIARPNDLHSAFKPRPQLLLSLPLRGAAAADRFSNLTRISKPFCVSLREVAEASLARPRVTGITFETHLIVAEEGRGVWGDG